jgi:uncharacterized protein YjeT (DUF2065 family)
MKTWVKKVLDMQDGALRRFGFMLMILGLGLVYIGRR